MYVCSLYSLHITNGVIFLTASSSYAYSLLPAVGNGHRKKKKESGGYLKIASFKNAENSENSEKSLRRNPMEICARLEPPFQTREKLCQVSHQNIKK